LSGHEATGRCAGGIDLEKGEDGDGAVGTDELHKVFALVVGIGCRNNGIKSLDLEEDSEEGWDGHDFRGEGRHPHFFCNDFARFVSFFRKVHASIVAIEDPGAEGDGDYPAVGIAGLFVGTFVGAFVSACRSG
jgi:hypothetical protein